MTAIAGLIILIMAVACVLVAAVIPFVVTIERPPKPYVPPVPKGRLGRNLNIYQVANDTVNRMRKHRKVKRP